MTTGSDLCAATRLTTVLGAAAALGGAALPCVASAQSPVLVGVESALAMPVAPPQSDTFGPGAGVAVAAHVPVLDLLVPVARVRGGFLSDGPAPADPTLRDPGVGSLWSLGLGLRLRPLAPFEAPSPSRATGAWVELVAGAALTGALVRPAFEAGLGWAFELDALRLGPSARLTHVLHYDDPIDSRSAFLVSIGAELVLLDARAPAPIEPPPPVIPDTDGDGLLDPDDGCPTDAEDRDGWQDEDGCPDLDDDADGLPDLDDRCPRDPEDRDGWQDDDGCPEPDNDGDGILDPSDHCPNEPEVVNGVDDTDGCPDVGLIAMIDDRIVLEETVLFDFERARVKSSARPVLSAIVALWRQHPEWAQVRIEGHADARGDEAFNQELSERRATHVRDALVEFGMPAEMFEVRGFGATRPRDMRTTETGFQRNRRVEFVVTGRRALTPEAP